MIHENRPLAKQLVAVAVDLLILQFLVDGRLQNPKFNGPTSSIFVQLAFDHSPCAPDVRYTLPQF